jgi:hypothetical protein
MHRVALFVLVILVGEGLTHPTTAAAQQSSLLIGPAPIAVRRSLVTLPDTVVSQPKKDHTFTGLVIGAGVGFLGGWAFYNAMCEAVDNNCGDSRVRSLVFGTVGGAALGSLIGSLVE